MSAVSDPNARLRELRIKLNSLIEELKDCKKIRDREARRYWIEVTEIQIRKVNEEIDKFSWRDNIDESDYDDDDDDNDDDDDDNNDNCDDDNDENNEHIDSEGWSDGSESNQNDPPPKNQINEINNDDFDDYDDWGGHRDLPDSDFDDD